MNRAILFTVTLSGALAIAGLVSAQTPKPATAAPASAPPAAATDSAIAAPPDPNRVVITVGSDKMTAYQFQEMLKSLPPQYQAAANGPKRREFVDQIVQLKVLAQEAERRNLEDKPEIKQQLQLQKENLLASSLFQDLVANVKITDADVEKYYNEHKGEFETAKAHHILIAPKDSQMKIPKDKPELTDEQALAKAKEAQTRLLAGESFDKVAKEMSYDSTPNGDLPQFTKGQMVPPFDEAAFTLPIGKISDPVKTVFGYHIIRVDSRETKTLAESKTLIEQKLRPEMARKEMEAIRAKANVQIDDTFFKPAAAGATK